jgi:uncharacterized membrane protein YdjX (TVP38/TMEM64 family)
MLLFAAGYVLATVLFVPGLLLTMTRGSPTAWRSARPRLGVGELAAAAPLPRRTLARDAIAARAERSQFAAIDAAVGREGFKIVLLTASRRPSRSIC